MTTTADGDAADAAAVDAPAATASAPPARLGDVPALSGVRALAALAVVLSHVGFLTGRSLHSDLIGPLLSRGNVGVTVFFLLSGFLLYRPFAAHSFGVASGPRTGRFFLRRAARILPALWLMVVLNLAFITPRPVPLGDWPSYLLLVQTYNHHDFDNTLTQLWSLTVEVSFYAILPVLAALVGGPRRGPDAVLRRQAALIVGLMVISAVSAPLISHHVLVHNDESALWLPNYLDWFAGGMALAVLLCVPTGTRALARLRATLAVWATQRGTCWLVSGVLFLIACLPVGVPRTLVIGSFWQSYNQHYLYLGAAFFFLLPLILGHRGGGPDRILGSRVGRFLGEISYSVYLWHPIVMQWWVRRLHFRLFDGHFGVLLVLTLLLSVLVASVSWFLVERPVLRLVHGRSRRSAAAAASSPATSAPMHKA